MNTATQINAVIRKVASTGEAHEVILEQAFPTSAADLWDACTNPARLPRWFEPIHGDLIQGGRYTLTGSGTEGTISQCEPPSSLSITWEYQGDVSHVNVRITPTGENSAALHLTHLVPDNEHWTTYGPAAAGAGWDDSLLALSLHLTGDPRSIPDEMAKFAITPEGRDFTRKSTGAWAQAHKNAGANPTTADAMAAQTASAYLGDD